jgi:glucose-1-phosphatase
MSEPDLIIFDLGRVLVDFDFRKVIHGLKRYSSLSEEQIRRFFMQTPLWDAFERGTLQPRDFFIQLSRELRLEHLTYKGFLPLWNRIFTEKKDTVSILRRLRRRYRTALLSNVNVLHWDYIRAQHGFMDWFDHSIASFEVGQRKPESAIFRTALKIARVTPARAVFIDDVKSHVLAARAVGLRAHQFIDAQKLIKDLDGILT